MMPAAIRCFRLRFGFNLAAIIIALLVAGCPGRKTTAPETRWIPRQPPWPNYEVSHYAVLREQETTGVTTVSIRKLPHQPKPRYELIVVNNALVEGIQLLHDSIATLLTADSLKPVNAFQVRALPAKQETVISRYERQQVIVSGNQGKTAILPITDNTFDNSILLTAIRSLPLSPGASYLLTSVASFGPWTKPADIVVLREDTVTVPAGRFICYLVGLQIAGHSLKLWYEKAPPHRYIRFEHPVAHSSAVLTKYAVLPPAE